MCNKHALGIVPFFYFRYVCAVTMLTVANATDETVLHDYFLSGNVFILVKTLHREVSSILAK